ncbi:MAG: outer membrane protein assembly factor BamE [Succinivibrionaceae bacterium]|nr:outer membrane protein assembly factor BamE [Succinivibrionaceae bacterium]
MWNKIMAAALASALLAQGCAYRADLAQGNFVEQEAVDSLRYGMSADQVRYVLGSPMLVDPFDSSRWYYVHFLREGWGDPEIKNLVVLFQGSTLVDISGDFKRPAEFDAGVPQVSSLDLDSLDAPQDGAPQGE